MRRTSNLDALYSDGPYGPFVIDAHARDLLTTGTGEGSVLAETSLHAVLVDDELVEISSSSPIDTVHALLGARCANGFRRSIATAIPDEVEAGTLLYFLLDDIPAVHLVAGFAKARLPGYVQPETRGTTGALRKGDSMAGFCAGFKNGGYAAAAASQGIAVGQVTPPVGDLSVPGDARAWHELPALPPTAWRRMRRIDVWEADSGALSLDVLFRDSYADPDVGELVMHEYTVDAVIDESGMLTTLTATPRSLPWFDCPGAASHVDKLVGTPAAAWRRTVHSVLAGEIGCTHLNDTVRSLAEVPALWASLSDRHRPVT
ncbi:MAG: DUF2889 domain-containing protein [Acidimicrobiia bacterium]